MLLNVICINANCTELAPIVYEAWPGAVTLNTKIAFDFWSAGGLSRNLSLDARNATVFDTLFELEFKRL